MIKRLYLADGGLTAPLGKFADDIAVDNSIAAQLTALNTGDYCYLTLIEEEKLEVIRIYRDYSGLGVDRAQSGTVRQSFSLAAKIQYRLTLSEIQDSVPISPANIYSAGTGVVSIEGSDGRWVVFLSPPQAQTLGGIDSRTEENELVLFDRSGMFGCCDSSLTGAPDIDGPYFYLTSQLYPHEVTEIMTPNPKDRSGNSIPPINIDGTWWLLTQPSMVEQYVTNSAAPFEWEKYGNAKAFSAVEQYIATGVDVGDWDKYGGEKEFTAPPAAYVIPLCYPLEMFLFGGAVTYDRALDAYINPTISVLDWVLEDG